MFNDIENFTSSDIKYVSLDLYVSWTTQTKTHESWRKI